MGISSQNPDPVTQAHPAHRATGSEDDGLRSRWCALHAKSSKIARMAGLAPEDAKSALSRFDAAFGDPVAPTLTFVRHRIEDIEHLLEMGLTALSEVQARGHDAKAPALALWREFYHAREAILATVEPAAA